MTPGDRGRKISVSSLPKRGKFAKFSHSLSELVDEISDDKDIKSLGDLRREINEDIQAVGKAAGDGVGLVKALVIQIEKIIPNMSADQLLWLALRSSEMVGDKSFLAQWNVSEDIVGTGK